MERVYEDRPEVWKKAIGDSLLFHLGIYRDGASSLEEAGVRFLKHTLELADVEAPMRVLDVGCGWGGVLQYLAKRFADCPRLDGINISAEQLAYAAAGIRRGSLDDRVRLFLCNAQDVRFLPRAPGRVPFARFDHGIP
ncbi:class I SAM-dependent methyltransferase [Streptomyces anulatus]|uniref:SAM-dependent methyltransferase n=1 Tax=Streptomyces anulatus TaxID=1892 RepID=UPI002DDBE05A|nr:class I SAM-dependent methyltransferase [Streptomyces anulatus]WSC65586.1 class I SAM-dependent methyltransferase [Streptomyces anulatus]